MDKTYVKLYIVTITTVKMYNTYITMKSILRTPIFSGHFLHPGLSSFVYMLICWDVKLTIFAN